MTTGDKWARTAKLTTNANGSACLAQRSQGGREWTLAAVAEGEDAAACSERAHAGFPAMPSTGDHEVQRWLAGCLPEKAHAAVLVVDGDAAFLATRGGGRGFLQQGKEVRPLTPGKHALAWGDQVLLCATPAVVADGDFFGNDPALALAAAVAHSAAAFGTEVGARTFPDGTLDWALGRAADAVATGVTLAAVRVGFSTAEDIDANAGAPLTTARLAAANACLRNGAYHLLVAHAEAATDYAALPEVVKQVHALQFLASTVGRHGDDLEVFLREYAPLPNTLALTLASLDRVGATQHRDILREAVTLIAPHEPKLAAVAGSVGIEVGAAAANWTCPSQWADAPDLATVAKAFVAQNLDRLLVEGAALTAVDERTATQPRRSALRAALATQLGQELQDETPLGTLDASRLEATLTLLDLSRFDLHGEDINALLNAAYDSGTPWSAMP